MHMTVVEHQRKAQFSEVEWQTRLDLAQLDAETAQLDLSIPTSK